MEESVRVATALTFYHKSGKKKTKVKLKKAQTYERNTPEIKQSLFLPEAAPRRYTLANKVLI